MVQSEAKKLYADYFETDDKEGIEIIANSELSTLGEIYENFQLAKLDRSSFQTCTFLLKQSKLHKILLTMDGGQTSAF